MPLCLCGSFSYAQESLTVAVASSFYQKAKAYSTQFEAKHDVKVRLVSGSTGRLFNQIKQGAPFDIFIAADKERPALLNKPSKLIALGFLGLQIGKQFSQNIQQLKQSHIRNIVIPNPEVAPFGKAAKQVLQQAGLWAAIKPKLVYAQNAMQAAMMVEQGLTDAGFVPADKENALAEVPYVVVVLTDKAMAKSFYAFIANGSGVLTPPSYQDMSGTKVPHPNGPTVGSGTLTPPSVQRHGKI